METCRRQTESRDARLTWLREDLSRRPLEEIVEFQMCLDQVTRQAFTWELGRVWSCDLDPGRRFRRP
ncbi:DUF4240 domain-containing protein [Streptomyces sp. NPDC015220]|uniref:DUF4240 domain-containing protein n=1 Tax=Streptomyces sp. NPDC015220 TaxID=3364947 RepID=UPI0036F9D10C